MWFIAVEAEDAEQLAHDLEPYPATVLYQHGEPIRIHQYLVVTTKDRDLKLVRTVLESECGAALETGTWTLEGLRLLLDLTHLKKTPD